MQLTKERPYLSVSLQLASWWIQGPRNVLIYYWVLCLKKKTALCKKMWSEKEANLLGKPGEVRGGWFHTACLYLLAWDQPVLRWLRNSAHNVCTFVIVVSFVLFLLAIYPDLCVS
jgi:hypothetical protein